MPDVSIRLLTTLAYGAGLTDADVRRLLAQNGLRQADFDDPEGRIDCDAAFRLIDSAQAFSGDPCFGLHAGVHARPASLGLMGHLVISAPTIEDAVGAYSRYQGLLGEGLILDTAVEGELLVLSLRLHPDLTQCPGRQTVEALMAQIVGTARWLGGRSLQPLRVSFRHPRPVDTTEHVRIFAAPVDFGAESDTIHYRRADLQGRLAPTDEELHGWLEERTREKLTRLHRAPAVRGRVYRALAGLIGREPATLARTATVLHVSDRTLQRRLRVEGAHFQEVLDEVRADLACALLTDTSQPTKQVAERLGFAETGSFEKAFKRWTGSSPATYRAARRN